MDYLLRFLSVLYSYLGEAAPYLVVGYFLVALIREYVPSAVLTRHLGGQGPRPLINALGIGTLLPVCSCGSIPLGIGLVRSGAAVGTTLTLMTSAPAISPVAVIVGYTLLGVPLLVVFAATVVVGSLLLGILGNLWLRPHKASTDVPSDRNAAATDGCGSGDDCCRVEEKAGHGARLRAAFRWAYGDLGAEVSVDLLVGLLVAAAVVTVVPTEWVVAVFGQRHWWSLLLVILAAIPVYTCTVPSMFIVHSLLLAGASPGAAIAFLVAGPATNLGELNAIRGAMGARTALYYVIVLVAVALAGGLVSDQLLFRDVAYAVPTVDGQHPSGPGWQTLAAPLPAWHYPFLAILVVVLVMGIVRRLRSRKPAAFVENR